MLEGVRETKELLNEADGLISKVKDRSRRAQLEQLAQQVRVPLTEATQDGHAFVYDDLEERLGVARRRLGVLFDQLANPER